MILRARFTDLISESGSLLAAYVRPLSADFVAEVADRGATSAVGDSVVGLVAPLALSGAAAWVED
jgi:hypothetical protein